VERKRSNMGLQVRERARPSAGEKGACRIGLHKNTAQESRAYQEGLRGKRLQEKKGGEYSWLPGGGEKKGHLGAAPGRKEN